MPCLVKVERFLCELEEGAEAVALEHLRIYDTGPAGSRHLLLSESIDLDLVVMLEEAAQRARTVYENQRVRDINPLAYELATGFAATPPASLQPNPTPERNRSNVDN